MKQEKGVDNIGMMIILTAFMLILVAISNILSTDNTESLNKEKFPLGEYVNIKITNKKAQIIDHRADLIIVIDQDGNIKNKKYFEIEMMHDK